MLCMAASGVSVQARSCAAPEPLEVEYRHSSAVFSGHVKSLKVVRGGGGEFDLQTVATFDVQRWWKGGRSKSVEVRSCGGNDGDKEIICTHGFEFELGVSYVVFATRRPLETSICLRTNTISRNQPTFSGGWSRSSPSRGGRSLTLYGSSPGMIAPLQAARRSGPPNPLKPRLVTNRGSFHSA